MAKSSKLIKKINEAMEILGDKQKRAKYDRDLELQERNSGGLSYTKSNTFKN
jgi:curved DNA-binding protein CbpA